MLHIKEETNVLKKFVNAAGFGLDHVNEEFMFSDFPDKLIAYYEASCGAAVTNVFHPICLSFWPFLCNWKVY
jgi:hypothetical protein